MVEQTFSPEITALQTNLRELAQKKKDMENEIAALNECLNAEGMPGLKGQLIDSEGFPRSDIDSP